MSAATSAGTAALEGGFADPPVDAAHVFRAAIQAMARPGTVHAVAGARPPAPLSPAAGALALMLADHDTGVWLAPSLDGGAVRDWLTFHTGAPAAARADARFAVGRWDDLAPIDDFLQGTPEYPDRSATLIVEVDDLGCTPGAGCRLTGPGIRDAAWLRVPDADALRANARRFPLGLDFFLTCGDRLAALPRTTRIG